MQSHSSLMKSYLTIPNCTYSATRRVLAINVFGRFREHRTVSELRNLIENWHISKFLIDAARPSAEAGYAEHLSTRGENVAQVAQYLYEHHPERF